MINKMYVVLQGFEILFINNFNHNFRPVSISNQILGNMLQKQFNQVFQTI